MNSRTTFAGLGLPTLFVDVLAGLDITTPTPIQAATLPDTLAGRDVLGRGRTGSGKTYGFLLPMVARLHGGSSAKPGAPRALILAPTRELVSQIEASLKPLAKAAKLSVVTVYGGVGQGPQVAALRRGVDVVVACPGRLEDLIGQGHCRLDQAGIVILDEADHMADLGFLPGVRRLLAQTPSKGQRMLFSATLDRAVDKLVKEFLNNPVVHQADSAQSPVATMSHHVLQIERDHRVAVVTDLASAPGRTVIFTRTKHGAKALARNLNKRGVPTVDLHGDLSQGARTRNLEAFHEGRATALVATDIAARGIHVDGVSLVVHADPPADHKAYLHRSGRTARAGESGTVITLAVADQMRDVRALANQAKISLEHTRVDSPNHPVLSTLAPGERVLSGALAPSSGSNREPGERADAARPRRRRSRSGATAATSGGARQGAGRTGGSAKRSTGGSSQSAPKGNSSPRSRQASKSGGSRSHNAASFSSGRR